MIRNVALLILFCATFVVPPLAAFVHAASRICTLLRTCLQMYVLRARRRDMRLIIAM